MLVFLEQATMFKLFTRLYKPFFFSALIFLLSTTTSSGQQVTWGFNIGGTGIDYSQGSHIDAAGNVYVCGDFRGTNVDFDPSPGTALRSSNGQSDAYVAKYTSTGQYLLCITFGGSNLDRVQSVSTDPAGNIYITGFFRGPNVDFDPSAATAFLSSNGDAGGDPGYGGDVFVAKYSPTGQYIWAFHVGGTLIGDNGIVIKNDAAGNAYVGGYFFESVDFDPSPASAVLNLNNGTGFIAKYNTNGQYQWALNFGAPNISNSMFDLALDGGGNVYAVGYFQGTNIDFDPSAAVAPMSSAGFYDAFVAKYTTNGQYVFSFRIGGVGADVTRGVTIDNAGNFYIVGDFTGSNIDFDPSPSTANVSSNGSADVFVAKYTSAGQYVWAFNAGSGGTELGWRIDNDNNSIFITGGFFGVSDFNPSPAIDNLTSNGGADVFLAKYTFNGVYECAFNVGSSSDDYGLDIKVAGTDRFYLAGYFRGSVDFAPTASNFTLNSNGVDDIFLIKYYWPPNTLPTGTVVGNTICPGGTAQLTFNALTGTSPFTLIYSNGTNSYTQTNVQSGVPFNVQGNPTVTTTYTVTLVQDAVRCSPQNNSPGMTATVVVNNNCTNDTTIVNDYTPVISLDPCKNIINVGNASAFNVGDTVLLIQMKGAVIDSSNNSSFGNITNYKNAGNYEFNYVKSKNGNGIELLNKIERQYDLPDGKVQLVRVPYFQNYVVNNTLSCLPWNGSVGGILVFNVQSNLTLNGNINVSGRGFKGGMGYNSGQLTTNCGTNGYFYPASSGNIAGIKGESIATVSNNIIRGKGALAGAGGGGLDHNSGGGGGANGGGGGFGGYQLEPCGNAPFDNRGIGGKPLLYNNASNKIFMGSGGGAGHANNPANINYPTSGGSGGGIIIITAQSLQTNSFNIIANGDNAPGCSFATTNDCHDAMGGGGAGGTVLLKVPSYIGNTNIQVKGGKGADMTGGPVSTAGRIGPGGGGGGGVYWSSTGSLPANTTVNSTAGAAGVLTTDANNPWGATAGAGGINLFNLQLPIDNILFKPNIDSVRIKDSIKTCTDFDFKGLGYTNTNPIASWQWYFGDGGTANTQNTSHNYSPGPYIVKLVVTDIKGCKDSIIKNIIASSLTVDAGNDSTICSGQSITFLASSNGGTQFQWTPASLLNSNTILNPTATPPAGETTFYLTATNASGCSQKDSVSVFVRAQNVFSVNAPSPVCKNDSVQLKAQGGDIYLWQPSAGINPTISNPFVAPQMTTTYTVQITDTLCGFSQALSTQVVVLSLPNVQAFKQNDIDCIQNTARLNASGAVKYIWAPAASLNNSNIASPVATPTASILYTVQGTDIAGCKNTDTISVIVDYSVKNGLFLVPNAFTPNNDGLNDCFGIKHWGLLERVEFNIYNRWGELIFHTTDASKCWDGTWKNLKQDPGVFVYWVRAKSPCGGDVFRKGTVVLIR